MHGAETVGSAQKGGARKKSLHGAGSGLHGLKSPQHGARWEYAAVWGKIANMPGYFRRKVPVSAGFFGGLTE